MTAYHTLELKVEARVATIRLNQPQTLNALNIPQMLELDDAVRALEENDAVRAVVLTAAGTAFCVGADLNTLKEQEDVAWHLRQLTTACHQAIARIKRLERPVIAAVNGVAAGGGLGLVLACDLAIAAESARLTTAFSKLGLSPDCGTTYHLVRLLGEKKAFELAAFSPVLDAQEALKLGLVNRVVADEALPTQTQAWAKQLAEGAPLGLARTKRLIQHSLERPLLAQLEAESLNVVAGGHSKDLKEGLAAFLEKRAPHFQGR